MSSSMSREEMLEQKRAYSRAWRAANRDRHRAYSREWYAANVEMAREAGRVRRRAQPEKAALKRRAYYAANKDKINVRAAAWAKANPEKVAAAGRRSAAKRRRQGRDIKQQNRAWLAAVKVERGCEFVLGDGSLCGWREHPAALEFDHRDPSSKRFTISQGASRKRDELLAEIAKCHVLCANHHRIVTVTKKHYTEWRRRGPVESPQLSLFEEVS